MGGIVPSKQGNICVVHSDIKKVASTYQCGGHETLAFETSSDRVMIHTLHWNRKSHAFSNRKKMNNKQKKQKI